MTDLKTALRAAVEALPGATPGPYAVDGFHTSSVMAARAEKPKAHEWKVIADCDPEFAKNANWFADAQFFTASANLARHAPALLAMVEECERLRAEVAATHNAPREGRDDG